jgi:hypothetical protein
VSTFRDRIEELRAEVGEGHIKARCVVDQAYAQNQHQTLDFVHTRGGRALYMYAPLMENWVDIFLGIARKTITTNGSDISSAMIEVAERMSQFVFDNAPVGTELDPNELRTSGHPIAEQNDIPYYDRPPISIRRPEGMPHS